MSQPATPKDEARANLSHVCGQAPQQNRTTFISQFLGLAQSAAAEMRGMARLASLLCSTGKASDPIRDCISSWILEICIGSSKCGTIFQLTGAQEPCQICAELGLLEAAVLPETCRPSHNFRADPPCLPEIQRSHPGVQSVHQLPGCPIRQKSEGVQACHARRRKRQGN